MTFPLYDTFPVTIPARDAAPRHPELIDTGERRYPRRGETYLRVVPEHRIGAGKVDGQPLYHGFSPYAGSFVGETSGYAIYRSLSPEEPRDGH